MSFLFKTKAQTRNKRFPLAKDLSFLKIVLPSIFKYFISFLIKWETNYYSQAPMIKFSQTPLALLSQDWTLNKNFRMCFTLKLSLRFFRGPLGKSQTLVLFITSKQIFQLNSQFIVCCNSTVVPKRSEDLITTIRSWPQGTVA